AAVSALGSARVPSGARKRTGSGQGSRVGMSLIVESSQTFVAHMVAQHRPIGEVWRQGQDIWHDQGVNDSTSSSVTRPTSTPGRQVATVDDTDLALVEALRADGRLSVRALAEATHISRANAYARLERL